MEFTPLPFEYGQRYSDLYRELGLTLEQAAVLEERDRELEDFLATYRRIIFHWPGTLTDHVGVRNGPGEFALTGTIYRIRYALDDDNLGAAGVTLTWEVGGAVPATGTHTVDANGSEEPAIAYTAEQSIIGTITAATGGSGLTAFVYVG